MRRMILLTAAVLALSMAVCSFSTLGIAHVVKKAQDLRGEAIAAMDAGLVQEAEAALAAMATCLEEQQGWLEILMEHDELHEIKNQILEAQLGLEFGVVDDFYQCMAKVGEGLKHIESVEKLTLSNLY